MHISMCINQWPAVMGTSCQKSSYTKLFFSTKNFQLNFWLNCFQKISSTKFLKSS